MNMQDLRLYLSRAESSPLLTKEMIAELFSDAQLFLEEIAVQSLSQVEIYSKKIESWLRSKSPFVFQFALSTHLVTLHRREGYLSVCLTFPITIRLDDLLSPEKVNKLKEEKDRERELLHYMNFLLYEQMGDSQSFDEYLVALARYPLEGVSAAEMGKYVATIVSFIDQAAQKGFTIRLA